MKDAERIADSLSEAQRARLTLPATCHTIPPTAKEADNAQPQHTTPSP